MQNHDEHDTNGAIPHTPGQAEGSENADEQSQSAGAPQQTDQAEGEEEDAE